MATQELCQMPPCRKLPESGSPKNGEPGGLEILTRQRSGAAELTRQSGAKREGAFQSSTSSTLASSYVSSRVVAAGLVSRDYGDCQTRLVCGPLLADVLAADSGAT